MAFYEIRIAGAFAESSKRLENAGAAIDSRVSLKFGLLSNVMDGVLRRNRAMALIATTFGLFVALLAMIGVYGVTSHATAERTREIGIRIALGAERRDVFAMLLGEMMRVVCVGVVFGLGCCFSGSADHSGAIWGVKTTDPLWSLGLRHLLDAPHSRNRCFSPGASGDARRSDGGAEIRVTTPDSFL